jgi:Recombination endonuclease VII
MKICNRCNESKDFTQFHKKKFVENQYYAYCKKCNNIMSNEWKKAHREKVRQKYKIYYRKNSEKIIKDCRQWRKENPHKVLDINLKRNYGITLEQYKILFTKQNGKCAICKKEESLFDTRYKKIKRLCVDHCHNTGKVRGLLCHNCNIGIGLFEDSKENMQNAVKYLESNE